MNMFADDAEDVVYGLSAVLDESTLGGPPTLVESQVLNALARLSHSESESFAGALRKVGRFVTGNQVRGIAGAALPIVGTAVGTAYGGPIGAAVGGNLGGVLGQAVAPKQASAAASRAALVAEPEPTPAAMVPAPDPAPVAEPSPPAAEPPTPVAEPARNEPHSGSPAAAQLLNVLQDPALLASLLALVLGQSGRSSVRVGPNAVDVPVGAMMNLVGVLANRAAEDAEEILAARQDGIPAYLFDESGCLSCDPAVPEQRANALLRVLSAEAAHPEYGCSCGCDGEHAEDWEGEFWW